jgi:hypothetical protein
MAPSTKLWAKSSIEMKPSKGMRFDETKGWLVMTISIPVKE